MEKEAEQTGTISGTAGHGRERQENGLYSTREGRKQPDGGGDFGNERYGSGAVFKGGCGENKTIMRTECANRAAREISGKARKRGQSRLLPFQQAEKVLVQADPLFTR
jgi:hypothetical protein